METQATRLFPSTKGRLIASECSSAAAFARRSGYASWSNILARGVEVDTDDDSA